MNKTTFVKFFDSIQKTIPCSEEWSNGTGYYDGAVKADLGLEPGEVAKSIGCGENKRRIILIGTRHGNVVVFERYTPTDDQGENIPVVSNAPWGFSNLRLVNDGAMSDNHFEEVVGMYCQNVGKRLEMIHSYRSRVAAIKEWETV